MAIKAGDVIVAHTRLAVELPEGGKFQVFVAGEVIPVGKIVSVARAQAWLDAGSAAATASPSPAVFTDPAA